MHLHDGRVHLDGLNLDADDLFFLQALKDLVQNPVLGPTVHAGIDGVPRAKALGQATPLAALFGNIKQRVEKLQIRHSHVAALPRQLRLYALKLRLGGLHLLTISWKLD
jgi:hypothetical protein